MVYIYKYFHHAYYTICCLSWDDLPPTKRNMTSIISSIIYIQCIYIYFFCRDCWGFSTKFTVWLSLKTFPFQQKNGLKGITPWQKSTKNLTKQPTTVLLLQGFTSCSSFFPAVNREWTQKPAMKCLKGTTAKCLTKTMNNPSLLSLFFL